MKLFTIAATKIIAVIITPGKAKRIKLIIPVLKIRGYLAFCGIKDFVFFIFI
jgi:hypothetical protein